jgi:hypothetical protein
MDTVALNTKAFAIDYFIHSNEKRVIKTHLTYSTSRKNAEFNTREMESPDRINIIKITPIVFDSVAESILNDALVAHIHNNQNVDDRDADESTNS